MVLLLVIWKSIRTLLGTNISYLNLKSLLSRWCSFSQGEICDRFLEGIPLFWEIGQFKRWIPSKDHGLNTGLSTIVVPFVRASLGLYLTWGYLTWGRLTSHEKIASQSFGVFRWWHFESLTPCEFTRGNRASGRQGFSCIGPSCKEHKNPQNHRVVNVLKFDLFFWCSRHL